MPSSSNTSLNLKPARYVMLGIAIAAWIFGTNYILSLRNTFRETTRLIELQMGYKLPIFSRFWLDCPRQIFFYTTVLIIILLIVKEFKGFSARQLFLLNAVAVGIAVIGVLFADYAIRLPLNSAMQQFSK